MEISSSVSINLRGRLRVRGRVCCRGVVSVCRRNGWRTIGWRTWRPIGASVKTLRGAGSINLATCQVFAAIVGRAGTISEPGKALRSTDNRRLGSRRLRRRFGRDVRGWRATLKDRYFSAVLRDGYESIERHEKSRKRTRRQEMSLTYEELLWICCRARSVLWVWRGTWSQALRPPRGRIRRVCREVIAVARR